MRRPRDQHPLHDRLEPQVELDRRPFGDTEDFDAQICRRRHRPRHLTLGPRAAAELASVEHERRSRVQAAQEFTSGVRHKQIHRESYRPRPARAKPRQPSLARRARGARAGQPLGTSGSSTKSGTSRGHVAAERGDLLDQAGGDEASTPAPVGTKTVSTSGQVGVHLRHLQLVVEVADRPQPLDDRAARRGSRQKSSISPVKPPTRTLARPAHGLARASRAAPRR